MKHRIFMMILRLCVLVASLVFAPRAALSQGQTQTSSADAFTIERNAITVMAHTALAVVGAGGCTAHEVARPLCADVAVRVDRLRRAMDPRNARSARDGARDRVVLLPASTTFASDLEQLESACAAYLTVLDEGSTFIDDALDGLTVATDARPITAAAALAHANVVEARCRPRPVPHTPVATPPATPSRFALSAGLRAYTPVMAPTNEFFQVLPALAVGPRLRLGDLTLGVDALFGVMRNEVTYNRVAGFPQWLFAGGADVSLIYGGSLGRVVTLTAGPHLSWMYVDREITRSANTTLSQAGHFVMAGARLGARFHLSEGVSLDAALDVDWAGVPVNGSLAHTVQIGSLLALQFAL